MAKESFINGKHDESAHEGRFSYVKRLAESEQEIIDFWNDVWPEWVTAALNGILQDDEEKPESE